jgi:hypothetical protein
MKIATLLFLPVGSLAIEAPTTPPFQHFRGLGESVEPANDVTISILDYGASTSADGLTNQKAVNAAFAAMSTGDTLVVPKGIFNMVGGGEGFFCEGLVCVWSEEK